MKKIAGYQSSAGTPNSEADDRRAIVKKLDGVRAKVKKVENGSHWVRTVQQSLVRG